MMKNIVKILLISFTLLTFNCSDAGSSGSSTTGFRINQDTLTPASKYKISDDELDIGATNIQFGSSLPYTANYAVLFHGPINDTNYLGIALSNMSNDTSIPNDIPDETFKVMIYFEYNTWPVTEDIDTSDITNKTIKVFENGSIYTSNDSLTLNIVSNEITVDPDSTSDTENDKIYTRYDITITGDATADNGTGPPKQLSFGPPIKTLYVGTSTSE